VPVPGVPCPSAPGVPERGRRHCRRRAAGRRTGPGPWRRPARQPPHSAAVRSHDGRPVPRRCVHMTAVPFRGGAFPYGLPVGAVHSRPRPGVEAQPDAPPPPPRPDPARHSRSPARPSRRTSSSPSALKAYAERFQAGAPTSLPGRPAPAPWVSTPRSRTCDREFWLANHGRRRTGQERVEDSGWQILRGIVGKS